MECSCCLNGSWLMKRFWAMTQVAKGALLLCAVTAASLGAAEKQNAPVDDPFVSPGVHSIQIEVKAEQLSVLEQYEFSRDNQTQTRPDARATVRDGVHTYTNVAIHLKGAMGSFRPLDDKPAFTLNFDKFASGQRFHGLQKIHLNNSVQDPSYLSEVISREIFLAAGVPTPRGTHATVKFNGRNLGLYVLVEGWNRQFLKRHFKETRGNLWDGGFARDITGPLELNSGEHPEDRAPLDALVEAARDSDLTNRLAQMSRVLDLDRFFTFFALEVMLAHWDGYSLNRNNYRVFHDLSSGKLVFLPHGLDQMFGVWRSRPEGPILPQMRGLVARAALQVPEGRQKYLARMSQLSTNVFRLEALTNRVNELAAKVRPALAPNRQELLRQERAVAGLQDRIIRRVASVREQLSQLTTPVAFGPDGSFPLTRWESKTDSGNPSFGRANLPVDTLQISAEGPSYGTWRTSVLLGPGRYRFEGRVKTKELSFNQGVTRGGVTLRKSGEREAEMHSNAREWTTLRYEFDTTGLEDIELLCELRASAGWAWFEVSSLRLYQVVGR